MRKRIHESGSITLDPATKRLRVCLISEGEGSSADYLPEFFTPANAELLAESLSFPGHPADLNRPDLRDPMTAIGYIGENVTIETHDGKLGFWGEYIPAESRPEVGTYLAEFASKLGLSIFSDSTGREGANGKWIAESLVSDDPYRSVDLVVAAGARGKFDRVAEGLRRITEASAIVEEKEVSTMEIKDVEAVVNAALAPVLKTVEGLVTKLDGKASADAQVEADTAAVAKAVEGRLADYDKAVTLINEAKLTESQSASARALALKGEDIVPFLEAAKQVLTEARTLAEASIAADSAVHLGSGVPSTFDPTVAGFGRIGG